MTLTIQEMVNMIFILGQCGKNGLLASREYAARYPELEKKPRPEAFRDLLERFEETGSVAYKKRKVINRSITNEENELQVLLSVQDNPQVSSEQISKNTDIKKTSVKNILRKHKYHGYHIELHQELYDHDFEKRIIFCNWMLNKIQEVPNILNKILFCDEASFKSNGLVNKHNLHYYSTENPHWFRQVNYQNRWSINVWGGILGSHVIGPHFLEERLTGEIYLNFLRNILPRHLEHVDEIIREDSWFQHDGAPPHYHTDVREFLNQWKENMWIGRGGPVAWPPRSPDLTPMDFFLWGYVKEKVYQDAPTTPQDMQERIREAFRSISPDMLQKVKENFIRRLNKCTEVNGRHFEHILRN